MRWHRVLLVRLGAADKIDWSRASLDSPTSGRKEGEAIGPNPTDRGKAGTKRHVLTDRNGIPLGAVPPTRPGPVSPDHPGARPERPGTTPTSIGRTHGVARDDGRRRPAGRPRAGATSRHG